MLNFYPLSLLVRPILCEYKEMWLSLIITLIVHSSNNLGHAEGENLPYRKSKTNEAVLFILCNKMAHEYRRLANLVQNYEMMTSVKTFVIWVLEPRLLVQIEGLVRHPFLQVTLPRATINLLFCFYELYLILLVDFHEL